MKVGSFGQELTLAVELLADAENLVARAGLNASSRDLLDLAQNLSKVKSDLSTMLPVSAPHGGNEKHLAQNLSKVKSDLSTMLPVSAPHGGNEKLSARRSMDPMKIALRVLTAHANGAQPDESDLNALERIYGEKPARMTWDIYACEAIQNVLRDRASARMSLALGTAISR